MVFIRLSKAFNVSPPQLQRALETFCASAARFDLPGRIQEMLKLKWNTVVQFAEYIHASQGMNPFNLMTP